jgi:hypothetical protein
MTQFTATKRKTERLCKSHSVIKNNINEMSMQFIEKSPACHPDTAPLAPARPMRGSNGTWSWTVLDCPYCHREHIHGGGSGEKPALLGHRVVHCAVGTPGYVVEVAQ